MSGPRAYAHYSALWLDPQAWIAKVGDRAITSTPTSAEFTRPAQRGGGQGPSACNGRSIPP